MKILYLFLGLLLLCGCDDNFNQALKMNAFFSDLVDVAKDMPITVDKQINSEQALSQITEQLHQYRSQWLLSIINTYKRGDGAVAITPEDVVILEEFANSPYLVLDDAYKQEYTEKGEELYDIFVNSIQ